MAISQPIISKLAQYLKSAKLRQIILLYSINVASIPLGILTNMLVTSYLGANAYGDYQFINNIFTFFVVLFTFGFFQAANRAIVTTHKADDIKEIYGATLVITISLSILMSIGLFAYSILDTNIQNKKLDSILQILIPFSWIYLILNYFEVLFQADNKITLLSIVRLVPKVGFLLAVVGIQHFYRDSFYDKVLLIWQFYIGTQIIVYVYTIYKIGPKFSNLINRIKSLWIYNKSFGLDVYWGTVFSVGLSQMTGILISYFGLDNSGVGFFSLAMAFSTPLLFIPNTIATTQYKEFSKSPFIPRKLLLFTASLSIVSLLILWLIIPPFINHFYGASFQPVIYLNFVVSIGIIFHGMADFYNRFLGSHGQGKILRNSSVIVGIVTLIANFSLIPNFGENGAVYARMISGITYFICMLLYYLYYTRAKHDKILQIIKN
ncbi:oligosaccharide flippase family protein [Dyadobacter subterraneus]|uniref:Oligosaccharide flippase family protein n=1 Tax=Dyadobacter subterraneus TaxID=2773304 RepID=A0ABR9WM62_9BACT|nr:oligosaccharide flippase family protein [Dyadobacter subterraneus]MBE9466618.1 oligosaccharide flippase family protein [Dyadobacter subterraneus]